MIDSPDILLKRPTSHPDQVKGHITEIKGLSNKITNKAAEQIARNLTARDLWLQHETKRADNATERENIESEKAKKFEELSLFDSLTGLRNRRYLFGDEKNPNSHGEMRRLFLEAERSGGDLSLIIFDGDDFKRINDTFGHSKGDVVLKKLADIILSTARESDIVARYGGEEFIVILQDTDLEEAKILADRINANVKKANIPNTRETMQTISAGVAYYGQKNNIVTINENDLINQADEALYIAKTTGKDKTIVYGGEEFGSETSP